MLCGTAFSLAGLYLGHIKLPLEARRATGESSDRGSGGEAVEQVEQGEMWADRRELDPCRNNTSITLRPFIYHPQDVVVPVPTAFYFEDQAKEFKDRNILLFYGGSPNSCTRRYVSEI